jgi:hypothetical protein
VGLVGKNISHIFFPAVKKHDEIRFSVNAIADLSLKQIGKQYKYYFKIKLLHEERIDPDCLAYKLN